MRYYIRTLAVTAIGLMASLLPPGAPPALAQSETAPSQLSGAWTIGDDFSDTICDVYLSQDSVSAGYAIEFRPTCALDFPILAAVEAWRPDGHGGIVLIDGSGETVVDYAVSETESLLSVAPDSLMLNLTPATIDPTIVGTIATHDDETVKLRAGVR